MQKHIKLLILPALIACCTPNESLWAQNQETSIKYQAQYVEFDKTIGNGAQRLIDNVVFYHNGAEMYCDSAYFYSQTNTFDAYNDIFIKQGDSIQLYGDFLHYQGSTKMATITGNVKLINRETTLTTKKLDYDLGNSVGFYSDHADIISDENTLESKTGYYYNKTKMYHFIKDVIIVTPDYKIYSDTLDYFTSTGIAVLFGPTNIIGDSSHVYCEKGWFDTKNNLAELKQNAWAKNNYQTVKGNYIFYDKNKQEGNAHTNVEITDTENNIILKGNKAKYNELTEFALMTDMAEFIQFSDGDTLFLHADTLKTYPDSAGQKLLFAYNSVKFYRSNVQGMCDSMVYSFADSVIRLYKNPVLWMDNYQVSADDIIIFTKNQQIERMELQRSSFIVSQEDTASFNQIKGKDMWCHFTDNDLVKIDVEGNGQTVYFAKDGEEIVGMNKIECSNMIFYFVDNDVRKIDFYIEPKGTLYPIDQIPLNELKLKGFQWLVAQRPLSKHDIFKK
ncbi:MAG: hypothetical protein JXB34_08225 [Bacteroidales bacterium]|nr:hypothetical protein [Bacteroidales bacterium]